MKPICFLSRVFSFVWVVFFVCCAPASADEALVRQYLTADYDTVCQAVDEAIEDEGLVISGRHALGEMLQRTGKDLGKTDSPILRGDVVQFCSARLAWQMIEEDAGLLATCPLAITFYIAPDRPERVAVIYRAADGQSPAQQARIALLQRVVGRALATLPPASTKR